VIFGASGDLTARKLIPALYNLALQHLLPASFAVIGSARRQMTEDYDSTETPTLVFFSGETEEVIIGFDPVRLDQYLDPAPSSDSVTES